MRAIAELEELVNSVLEVKDANTLDAVMQLDILLWHTLRDPSLQARYEPALVALLGPDYDQDLNDGAVQILKAWGRKNLWTPVVSAWIDNSNESRTNRQRLSQLVVGLLNVSELLAEPNHVDLLKKVYALYRDTSQTEVFRKMAYRAMADSILHPIPEFCDGRRVLLLNRTLRFLPQGPLRELVEHSIIAYIERRIRPFRAL